MRHTHTTFNPIWWLTIYADNGSRHRARIQLGHLAEAQRGEGQWKQLERLSSQNLSSRGFIKHRLHDTNKDCCWQLENTRTAPFRSEFPHQAKSVTRFDMRQDEMCLTSIIRKCSHYVGGPHTKEQRKKKRQETGSFHRLHTKDRLVYVHGVKKSNHSPPIHTVRIEREGKK